MDKQGNIADFFGNFVKENGNGSSDAERNGNQKCRSYRHSVKKIMQNISGHYQIAVRRGGSQPRHRDARLRDDDANGKRAQ